MAAMAQAHREALESQRRAAQSEREAALSLLSKRLGDHREAEVAALGAELRQARAAAEAEAKTAALLLENATNQVTARGLPAAIASLPHVEERRYCHGPTRVGTTGVAFLIHMVWVS